MRLILRFVEEESNFLFLFLNFDTVQKHTPKTFANIRRIKQDGIMAIKKVSLPSPSLLLKLPSVSNEDSNAKRTAKHKTKQKQ